jgi:hypothetical protein
MSTYSTDLKIEEIGTGEQAGTWGTTTNDNFQNVFEQAIVGRVTVPFTDANVTLTATNSVASQSFRNVYLNCTGTNTASRNLVVPTINKNYVVQNNTTGGFNIVVKTTAGTGITVPNGSTCTVYADGTNVIQAFDYLPTLTVPTLNITTLDATNIEVTNIKAKDGTASATIADSTGVMTIASSVLTTTDINGGTVDNTAIGATTASTGVFTQVDITAQGDLRLQDSAGGEYVALQAPTTIATSYTLTMPVDDGTSGQALITDGSGNLSWSTAASGDVYGPASATDNAIARFDGTTGKIIQNSVVTIADTTGNMAGVGTISSGAITSSSLTSGRVTYAGTAGLLQDDADFTFNGTTVTMANDASISGLTVGKGGGAVSTNTVVGTSSLAANTSGSSNVSIGYESSRLNSTGSFNVSLGRDSFYSNTSGSSNTAIGYSALISNTTASNNTAVGYQAGYSNTIGTGLVAIGYQALDSNTTGSFNTAVGLSSLNTNTIGALNSAFGQLALGLNTTGSNNTGLGVQALYSNTTASNNTAVGYQAAYSTTVDSGILAVGYKAAYSTVVSNNAAVGYTALQNNTTGARNQAFGNYSLFNNTTGGYNHGYGDGALYTNTTGSNNTALGSNALNSNTTASNNTAVGYQAGYSNVTGTNLVAIGYQALLNSTSSSNTAIGNSALKTTTTGNDNTAVGNRASESTTCTYN